MDEDTEENRLAYILPSHEYFHQSMVVADCENEMFRDTSKGLEGGSFFVATILNRKEAKTGKGKNSIDALHDFILLKADVRFCHYYIYRNNLDPNIDNTPVLLKNKSHDLKEAFLQNEVEKALRELLPFFKDCSSEDPKLNDHPLQTGRRNKYQTEAEVHMTDTSELGMDLRDLQNPPVRNEVAIERMKVMDNKQSTYVYACKTCSFQSKYKTVTLSHSENCVEHRDDKSKSTTSDKLELKDGQSSVDLEDEDFQDMFWNYKNGEFFMDSIFAVTSMFESFGDGLGCYIVNKVLLPIFHGLRHTNYSNSVHRFITRILCEATPKEAARLIHEKFREAIQNYDSNILTRLGCF